MPERIVIISDTHLGRPKGSAGRPEDLRPLWSGASDLVVNGDLAELTDPNHRVRAARLVCRLQDLCDADGVTLHFISGNHDPLLTDVRHMELCDGTVYLTHGDVLHPSISPWNSHASELESWNRTALAMLTKRVRGTARGRFAAAQHAAQRIAEEATSPSHRRSLLLKHARTMAVALWSWQTLPRRAVAFMLEHAPAARFFVFGHMHRPGIWRFRDRVVINTGSYGPASQARAVVIEDGTVHVHHIHQATCGHSLAADPIASFPIRRAEPEALAVAVDTAESPATEAPDGATPPPGPVPTEAAAASPAAPASDTVADGPESAEAADATSDPRTTAAAAPGPATAMSDPPEHDVAGAADASDPAPPPASDALPAEDEIITVDVVDTPLPGLDTDPAEGASPDAPAVTPPADAPTPASSSATPGRGRPALPAVHPPLPPLRRPDRAA